MSVIISDYPKYGNCTESNHLPLYAIMNKQSSDSNSPFT